MLKYVFYLSCDENDHFPILGYHINKNRAFLNEFHIRIPFHDRLGIRAEKISNAVRKQSHVQRSYTKKVAL